ncbi:hypothetical protein ACOME3_001599 [Neoechinorhynchus agilis]
MTLTESGLQKVPCSRSEVFASKNLTFREKRNLMKFCTMCISDIDEMKKDRALVDILDSTLPNISNMISNAICMVKKSSDIEFAIDRAKRLIVSAGRFGPSPLLVSGYGQSDICQGFCRFSAVSGATFYLGMNDIKLIDSADRLTIEYKRENGQISRLYSKSVLINSAMIDAIHRPVLTRCIFLRKGYLLSESKVSFFSFHLINYGYLYDADSEAFFLMTLGSIAHTKANCRTYSS